MRRMSTRKWTSGWALVATIGVVVSYGTAYAASLEDQQQAAGEIVTKTKDLAKTFAASQLQLQMNQPQEKGQQEIGRAE